MNLIIFHLKLTHLIKKNNNNKIMLCIFRVTNNKEQ